MDGKVLSLTEKNFDSTIRKGIVFVTFGTRCNVYLSMKPILETLAIEFEGRSTICSVDLEKERELSKEYGISLLPASILFKDGKEVFRLAGITPLKLFRAKIKEHASDSYFFMVLLKKKEKYKLLTYIKYRDNILSLYFLIKKNSYFFTFPIETQQTLFKLHTADIFLYL